MINYIKSQKWFLGVRREDALFYFSAKFLGQKKWMKERYGADFIETIIYPREKDFPVRVFNLAHAKEFHQFSKELITKDASVLEKFIGADTENWEKISNACQKLEEDLYSNSQSENIDLFNRIIDLFQMHGVYFLIIFSLGMKLEEEIESNLDEKYSVIIKKHNDWRNSIAFHEEKMSECVSRFLRDYLRDSGISPLELLKNLTINEVLELMNGKLSYFETRRMIRSRENGFIYAGFRDDDFCGVHIDPELIKQIAKHLSYDFFSKFASENDVISGKTAYSNQEIIRGDVLVVKDINELKLKNIGDFTDKILVTIQTSPHFIAYLKNVKAIITDEGGITCHAAIISREMKIPCVVGVGNATQILKNGDKVEIDAESGIVKIIKKIQ